MLVVAVWSARKKGRDVHSEVTYQGSHVISMTIFIRLPNTPKTYRPQTIIFPKPLEYKYIFSQFQVLQAVLGNCSYWFRSLQKQLLPDKFWSFSHYNSPGCTIDLERGSQQIRVL